jgi:hypothetical protein
MNEKQEIIARALEIAIKLTNADHTWLREDEYDNIKIGDPLYNTLKKVTQIISDESFHEYDKRRKIFRGSSVI